MNEQMQNTNEKVQNELAKNYPETKEETTTNADEVKEQEEKENVTVSADLVKKPERRKKPWVFAISAMLAILMLVSMFLGFGTFSVYDGGEEVIEAHVSLAFVMENVELLDYEEWEEGGIYVLQGEKKVLDIAEIYVYVMIAMSAFALMFLLIAIFLGIAGCDVAAVFMQIFNIIAAFVNVLLVAGVALLHVLLTNVNGLSVMPSVVLFIGMALNFVNIIYVAVLRRWM